MAILLAWLLCSDFIHKGYWCDPVPHQPMASEYISFYSNIYQESRCCHTLMLRCVRRSFLIGAWCVSRYDVWYIPVCQAIIYLVSQPFDIAQYDSNNVMVRVKSWKDQVTAIDFRSKRFFIDFDEILILNGNIVVVWMISGFQNPVYALFQIVSILILISCILIHFNDCTLPPHMMEIS